MFTRSKVVHPKMQLVKLSQSNKDFTFTHVRSKYAAKTKLETLLSSPLY